MAVRPVCLQGEVAEGAGGKMEEGENNVTCADLFEYCFVSTKEARSQTFNCAPLKWPTCVFYLDCGVQASTIWHCR